MPLLSKILVQDFRNISFQEIEFSPNINCISGNNGTGKTNLLDAIYYLSLSKSAFPLPDKANIRYGADAFSIGGTYRMENGLEERFSVHVGPEGKRIARGDKVYPRAADHIGILPLVMVCPGDIGLISESGEGRRRFSNAVLSQMSRSYLYSIQTYLKLLSDRNRILKSPSPDDELLFVLDKRMEDAAVPVFEARKKLCGQLRPVVKEYYKMISGGGEEVDIRYRSDLSEGPLTEILAASRERDRILKYTYAGLQRDDFEFTMNGHSIRRAGSQGQQKSFLLSLKFAQYEIMKDGYGFPPILLLDDVFDKLDMTRISHLISMVAGNEFGQIFITDSNKVRLQGIVEKITDERAYFEASAGEFRKILE